MKELSRKIYNKSVAALVLSIMLLVSVLVGLVVIICG